MTNQPLEISVEYPLKYNRLNPPFCGLQFQITDSNGKTLAYATDEAAAKLLMNFTNAFFKLVGGDQDDNAM